MNLYEITYLITPELTEEEAIAFNEKIAEKIKGFGATLHKAENPKKRFLAYKINNQFEEAYLACIDLEVSIEKIRQIESKLKEEKEIIRHLLVSKKEEEEELFSDFEKIKEVEEVSSDKEKEEEIGAEIEKAMEEIEETKKVSSKEKEEIEEEKEVVEEEEEEKKPEEKEKKIKLKEIDEKIDEIL